MDIITDCQTETLVYWAPCAPDIDGRPTYTDPPVEYTCRWDDKTDQKVRLDGASVTTRVELITEVLLAPAGLVLRGTLAGLTSWAAADNACLEVQMVANTPTLDGTENLYEAWL